MFIFIPVLYLHGFIYSVYQHSSDNNRKTMGPPIRDKFTEHIHPHTVRFFSDHILKTSFGFFCHSATLRVD